MRASPAAHAASLWRHAVAGWWLAALDCAAWLAGGGLPAAGHPHVEAWLLNNQATRKKAEGANV